MLSTKKKKKQTQQPKKEKESEQQLLDAITTTKDAAPSSSQGDDNDDDDNEDYHKSSAAADVLKSVERKCMTCMQIACKSLFPFLDKSKYWNTCKFHAKNKQLIAQGLQRQKLEGALCCWLGDGCMALLIEGRRPACLVVRELTANNLIEYHYYMPSEFPKQVMLPKDSMDVCLEKRKLLKKLGFAKMEPNYTVEGAMGCASNGLNTTDEATEQLVAKHVSLVADVNIGIMMKRSMWTQRFYKSVFEPRKEFLQGYTNNSAHAKLLNTFTGFCWTKIEGDGA